MGIRQAEPFQHALHTAILAIATMERIKYNFRINRAHFFGQIAPRVDLAYFIAFFTQRSCTQCTRYKRHLAFRRDTTF